MSLLLYIPKKADLDHLGEGVAFPRIFSHLLKNTGNIACNERFYRKKSSRLKINLYNVYRGGLNPTSFVGFSPPAYTLYKFVFGRLLLICENRIIPTFTRAFNLEATKYRRDAIPSPRWAKSDFFAYRRISNCLFFHMQKSRI